MSSAPLGSPDNRVTAFVGRHPRECGAVLAVAGAGVLWWQVVRPLALLDAEAGEVTLSPKLAALGLLIFITGLCYLVGGARVYSWLVLEKTPERVALLRKIGLGLGAVVAVFYFWLVWALEQAGFASF